MEKDEIIRQFNENRIEHNKIMDFLNKIEIKDLKLGI